MIVEILKHCRKAPTRRRLLTTEQKRIILQPWQLSDLSEQEFCGRYDLIEYQDFKKTRGGRL